MEAYLDNSATTKCAAEVVETAVKVMSEDYGNPSSKHMKGVDAEKYIREAKEVIAKTLSVRIRRYSLLLVEQNLITWQ